jgi:hypothetical protein
MTCSETVKFDRRGKRQPGREKKANRGGSGSFFLTERLFGFLDS